MAKASARIHELADAKRRFKALPDIAKALYGEATVETAKAIVARARPRVTVRFGILRDHLGYTFSKRTGLAKVGIERTTVIVGDRRVVPGRYGHLIEFGHGGPRRARAYPFLRPAVEEERQPYLTRIRALRARLEDLTRKA